MLDVSTDSSSCLQVFIVVVGCRVQGGKMAVLAVCVCRVESCCGIALCSLQSCQIVALLFLLFGHCLTMLVGDQVASTWVILDIRLN